MVGQELNRELFSAVASRIEKITGEKPDIFTPAVIAHLLEEHVITAILEGKIPGYYVPAKDSEESAFHAFFTPSELIQIRVGLSGPFAQSVQVGVDQENDQPITYVFESLGKPIKKKTLFKGKRVSLTKTTYHVPADKFKLKKF